MTDSFSALGLIPELCRALDDEGYEQPTPIQTQAIPSLLDGRDMLGCAQTGTGKTAAFALPVLQHLHRAEDGDRGGIRCLVLTPTRELAAQISASFSTYGRHLRIRHCVIFGGVKEGPQIRALKRGVDVLVATPGRLLDLHGRGFVDLGGVDFFVLDEADRMLDMGFIHDVRRVLAALPDERQNLLFSATMPETIVALAGSFLDDPIQVEVTPQASTVERVTQCVMFVERPDKKRLLPFLLRLKGVERSIVFTRTKHGANKVCRKLVQAGLSAAVIHGNKSQSARERALEGFRQGRVAVLVATDIAARGIDVDGVSHVVNYDLPNIPESYVHRIGRTARAGNDGVAISFCDESEVEYLVGIEELIQERPAIAPKQPWHAARIEQQAAELRETRRQRRERAAASRARKGARKSGGKRRARSRGGRRRGGRGRSGGGRGGEG